MLKRTLGHRAPLLWLLLPFMAGLGVGQAMLLPIAPARLLAGAALLGVIAVGAAFFPWLARGWALALLGALFYAGMAHYALQRARLAAWEELPPREARLGVRLDRIFPQGDPTRLVGLGTVLHTETHLRDLVGQQISVSLTLRARQPFPIRSTVISARGLLTTLPLHPPANTFDEYLANAGINFRLSRGRMLAVEQPPTRYRLFCEHAAQKLNALLDAGVGRKRLELAAVFRAMMLGQKYELTSAQKDLFMHSGTMHLFAINGLHIGVVAVSLHALLSALRCPRAAATLITLAVLWLDVDTTGASPSAVRAFILVACYEAARVLWRPANGLAALAAAGLIVLLVDPMAQFSASFQMSYGVVLAILCFGLPLAEWLQERWQPFAGLPPVNWSWLQRRVADGLRRFSAAAGIGVSATLVSAVTCATFFQVFTPAGLIINLVLVPLALLVITAGFASITVGLMGLGPLGVLFNHGAVLVLWFMDVLIRLSARVPATWWTVQWRAPWIAPLALVTILAAMMAGYAAGWSRRVGGFWMPFATVALLLALGLKF